MTVTLVARRPDTGRPAGVGDVSCSATAGGKALAAARIAFVRGAGVCVWRIPASAAGKRLRGTVVVEVQEARVLRRFTRTIKRR